MSRAAARPLVSRRRAFALVSLITAAAIIGAALRDEDDVGDEMADEGWDADGDAQE